MKRYLYAFFLMLLLGSSKAFAQNVFDPNDPDVLFTSSNQPPTPPYGVMSKWGHSNKNLGWNTYAAGFRSYFFSGTAFRLKYPGTLQPGVTDGKKYPVYVFLHGAGEPGNYWDNELHLIHGARLHASKVDNGEFDGFLLYAQSQNQYSDGLLTKITQIIDSLAKYVKADIDRVIVGGLSSGGSGTFTYLRNAPERWAAVTPISSASLDVNLVPNFLSIPIWIANGGLDKNPYPQDVQKIVDRYNLLGGDVRHAFFPNGAHGIWNNFWNEPGYFEYLSKAHKAQPVVKFNRTEWCPGDSIRAVMILQPGFYDYQWQKDSVTIAGANKDSLVATEFGSYRARFKRTQNSPWSDWSPRPVKITSKGTTVTPPVTVKGNRSHVLPAPDGSTTVPLTVPSGFAGYEWRRVSDNALVSDSNVLIAPVGEYKVRVTEQYGCSSVFSDVFRVVPADGANGPEKATDVTAVVKSNTSIEVFWSQNPSPTFNETGFEVYRSTTSGTGYRLVGLVPTDGVEFVDTELDPNTTYYYIVRAINENGASELSNEASAKTLSDVTPPSAPANLQVVGVTRHSVLLEWDASTDDVGVKNYEVYVNGDKAFVTTETSFDVNGLDSFKTFSFYVRAVDLSGNKSASSGQVTAFTKLAGLNYRLYQGTWDLLPDFSTLTPVKQGINPNISLAVSPYTQNYGMVWEGWINAPSSGTYTFFLTSDDGSALYIGQHYSPTATPLINHDGLHSATEVEATVSLSAGWHKIAIAYFQKGGGASLGLKWKLPGFLQSKRAIEDSRFRDGQNPSGNVPAKPTDFSAVAAAYNIVDLAWQDKSNNETGFEIYRKAPGDDDFTILTRTDANATSFSDSSVAGSTQYAYRLRAVNDIGESGFTSDVSVTTPAAPAVPGAPEISSLSALSATTVSISLSATGHTGFEIHRSVGTKEQFRPFRTIDTTAENITVMDSSLYAHTVVYYKAKSLGITGSSEFSAIDSVVTLNTVPVISPLGQRFIYFAGSSVIPVKATDPDGDNLTFTISGLPAFATFDSTGRGTGNLVFSTQPNNAGSYQIVISVDDGFGGIATETLKLVVNDNRPPVLSRIRDVSAVETVQTTISISAVDPDKRDVLRYTLLSGPSFVTSRADGNGLTLTVKPELGDAGTYKLTVAVSDGRGGLDSSTFTLRVSAVNPNKRIYINVLNSSPSPDAPWNNIMSSHTGGLLYSDGKASEVDITFTPDNWNTSSLGTGTGDDSGVFPDLVMRDNYYFGLSYLPDTVSFTLSGLDESGKYRITAFASSSYSGGSTVFETSGQSKAIHVEDNVSDRVVFNNLVSESDGTITVKMSKGPGTEIGYVNAIILEKVFNDGKPPKAPTDLEANTLSDGSIEVKWTNVAYNADGYQVLRSKTVDGEYTPLSAEILPDDTRLIDTAASSGQSYFYKIFAFNDIGNSDTVGIASAHTSNKTPVLTNIADVFIKAGNASSVLVEATDDPEDVLTLTVERLPSFATFQNTGNGTGVIELQPEVKHIGLYEDIVVSVTDSHGASANQTLSVSVSDSATRTVLINLNGTERSPWNNYLASPNPYFTMTGIVDDLNEVTPFAFKFSTTLSGRSEWGMLDGDEGLYSDNVINTAMFVNNNNTQTMQFTGLDPSKKYNLGIFTSYNNARPDSATFTSGGKTVGVNGSYNTNKNAYLNGLTPTPAGLIEVNFTKSANTDNFMLNALTLEEYNTGTLVRPVDLVAESMSSNRAIRLKWSDRSDSETGYEVYRSTSPTSGYSLITTTPANVSVYEDKATSLVPGQVYYYRVRAKQNTLYSEYSNVARFVLAKNLVLVNMNIPGFEASAPWNNTSNPTSEEGTGIKNLINSENINTGVDFTITEGFNGKGFEGVNGTGIFPSIVMRSNYWTDAGQVSSVKFSGLDLRQTYRVGIFNSVAEVTGRYFGNYTVNGVTKAIDGQSNSSKVVYFNNIRPDQNGEISISVTPDTRYSPYCFTNAFVLEGYFDPNDGGQTMSFANGAELGGITIAEPEVVEESEPVEDVRLLKVNAFPNPFVSSLTVEVDIPTQTPKVSIELFDLQSRLVLKKEIDQIGGSGGKKTLSIPVSENLAPGVYTLKVNTGDQSKTIKLVKSN